MQFALRVGYIAGLESGGRFRAEIGCDEVVRGFLPCVDVEAVTNFQDHRNLKRPTASHGIKRRERTGRHNVSARGYLRQKWHCTSHADEETRKKREAESQTVTCSPSCREITR